MSAAASFSQRPPPHVPHHMVVRAIGRGSYGEIWLGRSLTGAWRAIKIVERDRFDDSRAFDREFDGMAKFEPVSREHAGFVDILHVGRSDDDAFFYYVMELADDVVPREAFDPATYQPKTLKSELHRVTRLPADEAVALGLSLTLALSALHRHGLVHRDIKPANIIIVAGQPKIADIGLVSPLGQASFVGTEGYVPPEGPGTAQADIFSLGKVLYEIAMGKDRLDFPEVSTDLEDLPDREMLLRLNQVLWRACAHDSIDRYATADEMHQDLQRVRDGKPLHTGKQRKRWLPIAALLLITCTAFALWKTRNASALPAGSGSLIVETNPPIPGVQVRIQTLEGRWGPAGEPIKDIPAGDHLATILSGGNFEQEVISFTVAPGKTTRLPKINLRRAIVPAEINSTPPGCSFEILDGEKIVERGVAPKKLTLPSGEYYVHFRHQEHEQTRPLSLKRSAPGLVSGDFKFQTLQLISDPPGAKIFSREKLLGTTPCAISLLEGQPHELVGRLQRWPDQSQTVQVGDGHPAEAKFKFASGSVKIATKPSGAEVFIGTQKVGDTHSNFTAENLPPGDITYTLKLPGYKPVEKKITITAGARDAVLVPFEARPGPRPGQPWENSLGMKFVPVGDVLVGVWPVRVRDYINYCSEVGRARVSVDFPQDEHHPVVRVNWDDANKFCEWLTRHEFDAGKLDTGQIYRLPTDQEWSMAAGIPDEGGTTPQMRDGVIRDFPWGKPTMWPPPSGYGNYADAVFRQAASNAARPTSIAGYHDGFAQTSPVGSFPPNKSGLCDMSGNVWQWVSDTYSGGKKDWGVLRGGSWGSAKQDELRLGYRNVVAREEQDVIFGFRCVIVPESR